MYIAFSATDSYVDYMGTTMYSIIKNHPNRKLNFYVLTTFLSEHSKYKLSKLESDNVKIKIFYIDKTQFEGLPLKENISLEAYFRMKLSTLLKDIPKVMYLDCDILVNGDLEPYWNTDLTDYYLAGSNERDMIFRNIGYREKIGFYDNDIYVNSGSIILNIEKMREDNMEQVLFENADKLKDVIEYQDQDIINITFKGKVKQVPAIYNYTSYEREVLEIPLEDAVVIHFNWHKPWSEEANIWQYNRKSFDMYNEVYKQYINIVEEKVSIIVGTSNSNEEQFKKCLDTIILQNYKNFNVNIMLDSNSELINIANYYATQNYNINITLGNFSSNEEQFLSAIKNVFSIYVCFVDSADWLDNHYISKLVRYLEYSSSDIVLSEFTLFNNYTGEYNFFTGDIANQTRSGKYLLEILYSLKWYEFYRHYQLTGKLIKTDIIKKSIEFLNPKTADILAISPYLYSEKVYFTSDRLYVKNASTVEDKYNYTEEKNILSLLKDMQDFYKILSASNYKLHHFTKYYIEKLALLAEASNKLQLFNIENYIFDEINKLKILTKGK